MERVEIITADGRLNNMVVSELQRKVNAYLSDMEKEGKYELRNIVFNHQNGNVGGYTIEHFHSANIIYAPIGENTGYHF